MAPQRAYVLVALVIGIGIGIGLPRAFVDVSGAGAATRVTWRCLTPDASSTHLRIYNPSTTKARVGVTGFEENGSVDDEAQFDVAPRGTVISTTFIAGAATTEVRGPAPILVAAYLSGGNQVACFKKPG